MLAPGAYIEFCGRLGKCDCTKDARHLRERVFCPQGGRSLGPNMTIRDLEFTMVEAKRFTRRGERMQVDRLDQNSSVSVIYPVDDQNADIEFRFTVTYGAVASIRIEGRLIFTGDAKALVASWRDKKTMPNDMASEIHTAVMTACLPEAVCIAKDMHLPPPIPIPQVKFDGKPGSPTKAAYSPEVG
jgi:hypothetical protein